MSDPTSDTPPVPAAAADEPGSASVAEPVSVEASGPYTEWVLPPAIADFFAASNAEDRERFLAAFAADAVLDDWGRTFTGRDGIAAWNESDNMGVHSRFEVRGVTVNNGIQVVSIHVTGEGYNGAGTIAFQLEGELVSRVDITG